MQRFLVQPLPVTLRAGSHPYKLSRPFLCGSRSLALLLHQDIFGNTFIRQEIIGSAQRIVFNLQTFVSPVHDLIDRFFRDIFDRGLQRYAIFLANSFDLPKYQGVFIFSQRHNPTAVNAERGIGDDFVHVQQIDLSQSFTFRASTLRRVEREIMGSRFAVRQTRHRIHQPTAEMAHFVRLGIQHEYQAVTLLHSDTQAFFQTTFVRFRNDQFIDHNLDTVHLIPVELHAMKDLLHLTIHPDIQIAFFPHLFEKFLIMSLTVTDKRSEQVGLLPLILVHNQFQRLLLGVFHHLLATQIRISLSRPCIKQTEKVINLGSRPHCGSRILVCCFLLD